MNIAIKDHKLWLEHGKLRGLAVRGRSAIPTDAIHALDIGLDFVQIDFSIVFEKPYPFQGFITRPPTVMYVFPEGQEVTCVSYGFDEGTLGDATQRLLVAARVTPFPASDLWGRITEDVWRFNGLEYKGIWESQAFHRRDIEDIFGAHFYRDHMQHKGMPVDERFAKAKEIYGCIG